MDEEPDFLVLEMGMNRQGEMKELADIYFPDLGIITNIGTAHIGIIGSRDGIALEKRSIFSNAGEDSVAVLPADDEYFQFLKEDFPGEVRTFSIQEAQVSTGLNGFEGIVFFWEGNEYRLPLSGRHNVSNALAAMTAAKSLGATAEEIALGLSDVRTVFGRGEFLEGSVSVYQDCYNANPDSMLALLSQTKDLRWPKEVHLVLGEMRELGQDAESFHLGLAQAIDLGPFRRSLPLWSPDEGFSRGFELRGFLSVFEVDRRLFSIVHLAGRGSKGW
jgi:UDP-N-acetylmuramoyl-tripeptide--D-alanyl-D-alanine ligase